MIGRGLYKHRELGTFAFVENVVPNARDDSPEHCQVVYLYFPQHPEEMVKEPDTGELLPCSTSVRVSALLRGCI